jgi:hypothetical protein
VTTIVHPEGRDYHRCNFSDMYISSQVSERVRGLCRRHLPPKTKLKTQHYEDGSNHADHWYRKALICLTHMFLLWVRWKCNCGKGSTPPSSVDGRRVEMMAKPSHNVEKTFSASSSMIIWQWTSKTACLAVGAWLTGCMLGWSSARLYVTLA